MTTLQKLGILLTLVTLFLAFSVTVYFRRPQGPSGNSVAEGKLVWQKYNCQSCHQLYGLGGYLGPDLTDVYSKPGKGPLYIRAMLHSGVKQMPAYRLPKEEEKALLMFLAQADSSGSADPRDFRAEINGMIEPR